MITTKINIFMINGINIRQYIIINDRKYYDYYK